MKRFIGFFAIILLWAALPAAAQKMKNADCLACHNDASLTKDVDGKPVSVHVDEQKFGASIHSFLGCTDCHTNVKAYPHEVKPTAAACATCHADQQSKYLAGIHAKARKNGHGDAAGCLSCHGNIHEILPGSDPNSRTYRTRIPETCGTCHSVKFVMERNGISNQPFISYEESVHGRAVAEGSLKAAVCTDCHSAHDVRAANDPKSHIFKFNVPNTCGTCHSDVRDVFKSSIHGQALARGNSQAPVCTDCHGIHLIKRPTDPGSMVSKNQLAKATCGRCHEGMRLAQDMGVTVNRSSSYNASYHGLAQRFGSDVVANCASCHGVHNILPSTDPKSTVAKNNLVKTCGVCHNGATQKFVEGRVHIDTPLSADIGSIATAWIRRFYLLMIFATIGGMLLHNFLVWRKKIIAIRQLQDRTIVRMDIVQRYQHLVLLISFITLVITGFALKYPDSWLTFFLGSSEKFRSVLHRIAGVSLIGVGLFHIGYVLHMKEGRRFLLDMLPVFQDGRDVVGVFLYYLGLKKERPRFGRFNYAEKFEYWALVWGTIVMALTGLGLWFAVELSRLLARWWIDIATTIHFYEAILATLAIAVWHFYMVIFDPDVYPMNWAWLDGKVTEEQYQHEHELDMARVKGLEDEPEEKPAEKSTESKAETAAEAKAKEPEVVEKK